MPFASAFSAHPVTAHATGEVIGAVIEQLGPHPDLAFLFATPGHAGALEDAAGAVRALLAPSLLLGCTSPEVIGPGPAVAGGPGLVLWAGLTGPVRPFHLASGPEHPKQPQPLPGWALPPPSPPTRAVILLGAAQAAEQAEEWVRQLGGAYPTATLAGAMGVGPTLVAHDRIVRSGALGVAIGAGAGMRVAAAPASRPIGPRWRVTRAEGHMVYELSDGPAFARLSDVARDRIPAQDIPLVNSSLHLAIHRGDSGHPDCGRPDPGDTEGVVLQPVLGTDPANGALALPGTVEPGATAQFHVVPPDATRTALLRAGAVADIDAAVVFAPPSIGRSAAARPARRTGSAAGRTGSAAGRTGSAAGRTGPTDPGPTAALVPVGEARVPDPAATRFWAGCVAPNQVAARAGQPGSDALLAQAVVVATFAQVNDG